MDSPAAPIAEKTRFIQAVESYGVAMATGNQLLIQSSAMLLKQWFSRMPETFPKAPQEDVPVAANHEPGGMP